MTRAKPFAEHLWRMRTGDLVAYADGGHGRVVIARPGVILLTARAWPRHAITDADLAALLDPISPHALLDLDLGSAPHIFQHLRAIPRPSSVAELLVHGSFVMGGRQACLAGDRVVAYLGDEASAHERLEWNTDPAANPGDDDGA